MGLNRWQESDNAADFVFGYKEANSKVERRKLIDKEFDETGNSYNTPGVVNIALALEDGIVRKDDFTVKQIHKLRNDLTILKLKSSEKFKNEWGDEDNRLMHNDAYSRFLKLVRKIKPIRKPLLSLKP